MNLYQEVLNISQSYPNNTALVDDLSSLSYRELIERVKAKALELEKIILEQSPNFQDNCVIAINLKKDINYIVSQLAINKLNFAFLPLSIKETKRNEVLLNIAKPLIVIEEKDNIIHKDYKSYDKNVRYVIFTSGTTGSPKGVLLQDSPVVEVVRHQAQLFNLSSQSRFAWFLSPSFDASLSDIYATLLSGSTLYIPSFTMDKIKMLERYCNDHKITHTDLSPSILSIIERRIENFSSLKTIIFGGEVGNIDAIKKLSKTKKMCNAYGPTETTICSSVSIVREASWQANNIGQPLKGVMYKIAPNKELLIGGEHVALGYMGQNNNRFFVEDNISWYKTGDLCEIKNGDYYFLGRVDRQFKYHGQLICPEEIEETARKTVSLATCLFMHDKIYLFYVSSTILLKEAFSDLPSYMTPHYLIKLESLPLNTNGKIDVKALATMIENRGVHD